MKALAYFCGVATALSLGVLMLARALGGAGALGW